MRSHSLGIMLEALTDDVKTSGDRVEVEKWHGVPTAGKPDLVSIELTNIHATAPMPQYLEDLVEQCRPNLPWADDHFAERVSRTPSNPGEQYKNWPHYTLGSNWDEHFRGSPTGKFTHTYMERFWPKEASEGHREWGTNPLHGIQYDYGDLDDVVDLLLREPLTRQAWLPVWFPEDTGVVHGGRVPCTLGYQFMLRNNKFHLWYVIRSCDVVRYLRDDVYMAVRLAEWVLAQLQFCNDAIEEGAEPNPWQRDVKLGDFTFVCFSLHMFEGDRYEVPR